jgi:pyruvate dehydrogenase E1 component beta subunit
MQRSSRSMPDINMVDAINMALRQEMDKDASVMILGEDVGKEGGVFRVTAGLQKKFGKQRVVDTPLSESGIIGTSIGLSAYGMKPVAEVQFSGFLYPGFDQLISHAARLRTRSRGRFSCPMVVRTPYSGGIRALEHHSESMEAIYAHTPGLKMVIPSTPYDAKGLLIAAIRDPDPVVFFEPKRIYRAIKQDVPTKEYVVPLGKAEVKQEGKDVTLIAYGAMVRECEKAADVLKKERINCEVVDVRSMFPFDSETIVTSVKKTGRAVIVHEAPRFCGMGAEISAVIHEQALYSLEAPVERVTGYDTPMPLYMNEMKYLPGVDRIFHGVKKVMG